MNSLESLPESAGPPPEMAGPRGWRRWLEITLLDTFIVLSLYVLSIGPLYWQWYSAKFVDGPSALAAFYEPLFLTANSIPAFGDWMDRYVRWWIIG